MRRGISIAAAVTTLALGLTACGGSNSDAGSKPKDPKDVSGAITWWDTSNDAEAPAYKALVADFEKKYPKIKVKRVAVPFDQAQQKFKTAAQAKKGAPDVIRAEVGWTPGFASLGYLAPLDGTPALDKADDYLKGPLEGAKFNGKTYAVPQVTDTLALLYNKEILKKAGISEPPKTWAEIEDAAKKIKSKVKGVTTTYVNPDAYFAWPFLYGEGSDMVDVDAKKITINSPESVKGIKSAVSLIKSGAANKPDTTEGYNNMQAQMASGKLAMIVNGPWATGDILKGKAFKDNKDNLGIAPIPGGSAGSGAPTGGHNLAVYAASKNLDASYLFVKFMNSAENQAKIAVKNNTLPTRASAYTSEVTADPVRAAFKKALDAAKPRPSLAVGGDLFADFAQNYAKILSGSVTVQQGLDNTAKAWKSKFLKDYSVQ
jgi:arabinogalactan oligomer/maltooligosaccharide transport system substrate-binding protein